MDDLMQIYFEREYYIFDANFFHWREKKKVTYLQWYSFQIYELYFSINIDNVCKPWDRGDWNKGLQRQQQN